MSEHICRVCGAPLTVPDEQAHTGAPKHCRACGTWQWFDRRALMWLGSRGWVRADETNPRKRLDSYRAEDGGLRAICPLVDDCPHMAAPEPSCLGIVWCPVYNGGWEEYGNSRQDWREDRREHRIAAGREMIAEAKAAREYADAEMAGDNANEVLT